MAQLILLAAAFAGLFFVVVFAWLVATKLRFLAPAKGVGAASGPPPYRVRERLLSPAEASFYGALRIALGQLSSSAAFPAAGGGAPLVFVKVRLADVLRVESVPQPAKATPGERRGERAAHQNRIDRKRADFVLCDPATTRPVLVIELDDASHATSKAAARDAFVDTAYAAAGLPVIHVRAAAGYQTAELARRIAAALGKNAGVGS